MTTVTEVERALGALAEEAFAAAELIQDAVLSGFAAGVRRAGLAGVAGVASQVLGRTGTQLQGAGFVAAVGLMRPEERWLEWFVRADDGDVERLEVPSDPNAPGFFDYSRLPWYRVPREQGGRHVTGPYVDNICTEDYTLTFTQPLTVDGDFAGVCGADVGVRAVERALLPILRGVRAPTALLNAEERIVVSNTGALVCGELLAPEAPVRSRSGLRGLPLAVVTLGS